MKMPILVAEMKLMAALKVDSAYWNEYDPW